MKASVKPVPQPCRILFQKFRTGNTAIKKSQLTGFFLDAQGILR